MTITKQAKIEIILHHIKDAGLKATVNYNDTVKIFYHVDFLTDEVKRITKEFIKLAYLPKD